MSDRKPTAAELLRGSEDPGEPQVRHAKPYIRSGEQFIFNPGGARGAVDLGALVIEWGYQLKPTKDGDIDHKKFKKWLTINEQDLRDEVENLAAGFHYLGTYVVLNNPDQQGGQYRTIWAYDSADSLGNFGVAAQGASNFGRLLGELLWHIDRNCSHTRFNEAWYQPARLTSRLEAQEPGAASP